MTVRLNIGHKLDNFATFHIGPKNTVIVNLNSIREGDGGIQYTKNDLANYYAERNTDKSMSLIRTADGRMLIHSLKHDLLFMPLCNKKTNIIDYIFSEFKNFDKAAAHTFHRIFSGKKEKKKKYAQAANTQSTQEIIFGRKARPGYKIDHINSNGLDNRSCNLRELSDSNNVANRVAKNEFKGVSWHKKREKWQSMIQVDGKRVHLGDYTNPIEAARIYDIYSLHHYKDEEGRIVIPLNQVNGKNILSDEEIEDVRKNGIPEKYLRIKKEREFPTNISKKGKSFCYTLTATFCFRKEDRAKDVLNQIKNLTSKKRFESASIFQKENDIKYYFTVTFYKSYKSLQETEEKLSQLKIFIKNVENMERKELENDIDNYRNENGIAIILAYNGKTQGYDKVEVDDEDWKEYIHYMWYVDNNYPRATIDGILSSLHLLIFKKIFPNLNMDGKSVDHHDINPLNCRRINLRPGTGRQQAQNRRKRVGSTLPYVGIVIKYASFYVSVIRLGEKSIKKGPYEFMEDAAAEYNKIVKEKDSTSTLNIIPDTKTTIIDLFHKDVINEEFIRNIEKISVIECIFKVNNDWKQKADVVLGKIYLEDIEYYKEILLKLITGIM